MTGIVEGLQHLPLAVVLAVAMVLVAGETGVVVGLLFPVEITLMTVGFVAHQGQVSFWLALLLMLVAAGFGDALALRSGRKYGPRLRASRVGDWVGERRWSQADRLLRRLGGRSAFVARWVPFARTLLPRLAGSAGMSYRGYAPWNFAGVVTAVGSSVLVGYLAGASYARVAESFGRATTAVLLLLLAAVGVGMVGRVLGRYRYPVRALLAWTRTGRRREGGWWAVADAAAGLAAWLGVGVALAWTVLFVVGYSGLPGADIAVSGWFADVRVGPGAALAAGIVVGLTVLVPGSMLVLLVLAVSRMSRNRYLVQGKLALGRWAAVASVLLALAMASVLAGGDGAVWALTPAEGVSASTTLVTAGGVLLGWRLLREFGGSRGMVIWPLVTVGAMALPAARLYLGSETISSAAAATLLALAWLGLLAAAGSGGVTRSVTISEPASRDKHPKLRSQAIPET